MTTIDTLVAAAQVILDRCLGFFEEADLEADSSLAMPVVIKARDVYALRAALGDLEACAFQFSSGWPCEANRAFHDPAVKWPKPEQAERHEFLAAKLGEEQG